jgi:hypothetical protein
LTGAITGYHIAARATSIGAPRLQYLRVWRHPLAMNRLNFRLDATAAGSRARAARLTTAHNEVLTPTFMPVGTHAAVRSQRREDLLSSGVQVLLANTYHLLLRPGIDIFEKFGGIHGFMNWPRSVLTDSGGFQIFSLPGSRTIGEDGAEFKSYVDNTDGQTQPGNQHRGAEIDRRRHHDGARSVRAVDRRARGRASRHGIDASLGTPQSRRTRRFGAGLVRHRAGRELRRIFGSKAPHRHRHAVRRIRDRRSRGRRKLPRSAKIARRSSPNTCRRIGRAI